MTVGAPALQNQLKSSCAISAAVSSHTVTTRTGQSEKSNKNNYQPAKLSFQPGVINNFLAEQKLVGRPERFLWVTIESGL